MSKLEPEKSKSWSEAINSLYNAETKAGASLESERHKKIEKIEANPQASQKFEWLRKIEAELKLITPQIQ